ncbi:MAG TPA: hypothetical protein VLV48_07155, partial [Thermoanaerobaculia bacterium]|nr:hypothetical protein [Thermoanaerobaculia bacterium]
LLQLHWGSLDQDLESALVGDLEYETRRVVYSWVRPLDALSLEMGEELRDRTPGRHTGSTRVAVRYRRSFRRELR